MKRMSAFVGLCVVAATLATTGCNAGIAGQPEAQNEPLASFRNIPLAKDGVQQYRFICTPSPTHTQKLRFNLVAASKGKIKISIRDGATQITPEDTPPQDVMFEADGSAYIFTPTFQRKSLTTRTLTFTFEGGGTSTDSRAVTVTGDEPCSDK